MLSSIKSITVNYDAVNEGKTFSSGDVLSGRVLLALSKETKIEGLRVKMKGKAEVHWSERHGDKTRYYSSKEKYFKLEQLVTGQEKGNDVLAAGSHVFPFTFQIPQGNMPSSFKGDHGKVEYKLEAKLSRSWRLPSNAASEFTFVSRPDMGVAQLMSPQHGTVTKKMNLFTSGNAALNVNIERTAYQPGEELKVTVDIQNSSSRNLAPKVAVDQIQCFSAQGKNKVCTHRILKHVGERIPANVPQMLTLVLKLPPNLLASVHNCGIIRVEYFLKVYLDVPFASDPEVKLPLVILPAELSTGGFPYQTAPGAAPFPTAPGGFPYQTAPGAAPFPTAPGGFPYQTAPGAAPFPTAPGGFPYQTAPGSAPPPAAPGAFPYQPAPGSAPPPTAPGAFPYQPAPGSAPPPAAPGAFPYQPAPGSAPPPTAPGAFPYQPAPGSAPPPTAPGAFPYQPAPASAPPPAAPGAFPYQPAPGSAPPPTAQGAFPYQPAPASAPPPTAPGAFPYQPAPGSAPPPTAPGAFPYQPAPASAPPPTAPGAFPYQPAPGSAPPPAAPGAFPYQPPPGESYTFLSYSSPDAPPTYDILGQYSPQSLPSAPPSYSDAIKCPPPTAPGSSPPQMPQDTTDSTLDTFKSLKIN